MTVALSVTIRPQFAIECLRLSNQQGVGAMGPNLGVFPLEQTRHVGVAKSERPRLTMVKLFSKNSNLCDHNSPTSQTDRRTDRRHAIAIPRFALKSIARKKITTIITVGSRSSKL